MKIRIYAEYGALNSKPVLEAVKTGLQRLGYTIVDKNEDVSVIWSVLWHGRMTANKDIYYTNKIQGKRTLIIEVGNLKRGILWRVSLDHINKQGFFGNTTEIDQSRPSRLGIHLLDLSLQRNRAILIASQHEKSLQWDGMPPMHVWINQTIAEIRKFSDRPIVVRPHPRSPLRGNVTGGQLLIPKKIHNTYDDFDIDYNYHCVINYNSGPAVQSAVAGVPIICHSSSLASDVSSKLENIENISLPDRNKWFVELAHTEWSVQELAEGTPFKRILSEIY